MKEQREISVIVCTYNRCESLRDTLATLQAQVLELGVEMEILVVDNNSTDRTRAVVEAAKGQWPVRYLFEPRQGKSYALNRGIEAAHGEFLAFTDDDIIPEPTWIQVLWSACRQYDADCVGGKILPLWLRKPPSWLTDDRMLRDMLWGMLGFLDRGDAVHFALSNEQNLLFGGNLACRRSVFDKHGLFRVDLGPRGGAKSVGEETELLSRVLASGGRVAYIPGAIVFHKIWPDRTTRPFFRRRRFQSGRAAYLMSDWNGSPVPRWFVRESLEIGLGAVGAYLRGAKGDGVRQELEFWTRWGQIVESKKVSGVSWFRLLMSKQVGRVSG